MNTNKNGQPVYLILGATGGIGSELGRRLAEQGSYLMLGARTSEKLERLANELGAKHLAMDATQTDQVERSVEQTVKTYGRIDGIANCVGSVMLKPAHLTSDDEWAATIAVNLTSAFATVRAAARAMRPQGGSVVLTSSAAARVGIANHEAIAAAKAVAERMPREHRCTALGGLAVTPTSIEIEKRLACGGCGVVRVGQSGSGT